MDSINEKKDEDIAAMVQAGDIESFGILIERYENKIKRYARKFLQEREDINDIVQETFIKTYVNIKNFDTDKKFSSWLYRIAHNEFVNALKKKSKNPFFLLEPDKIFPHPVSKERPDRTFEEKEVRSNLESCLKHISDKYRELLVLYYFEDFDYKEIAEILHIPISTVGVRLKRAKQQLKKVCKKLGINHQEYE